MELTEKCELCPRKCGANRLSGKRGFCGGEKVILLKLVHSQKQHCFSSA